MFTIRSSRIVNPLLVKMIQYMNTLALGAYLDRKHDRIVIALITFMISVSVYDLLHDDQIISISALMVIQMEFS